MTNSGGSTRPARIVREGSVGLLILLGLALFGGLIFWLRGFSLGGRGFRFTVEFKDAAGMKVGALVRYRGVAVGRIDGIRPGLNGIDAELVITSPNLLMPKAVDIAANQSGLIGETIVDITPLKRLPENVTIATPIDAKCDRQLIICTGDRMKGEVGVSLDAMIRSTTDLVKLISDPQFFADLRTVVKNASKAVDGVTSLSRDLSDLSTSVKRPALNTLDSVERAADEFRAAAAQVDGLLRDNRSELVSTLDNMSVASRQAKEILTSLAPTAKRIQTGDLMTNLEKLALNASQAAVNLKDFSRSLNNPANALMLQQTLDAARVTFQNAQKITSDVDELTGDPKFREKVRRLVDGLNKLVSTTEQVQQLAEIEQRLRPLSQEMYALAKHTPRSPLSTTSTPFAVPSLPPKSQVTSTNSDPSPAATEQPSPEASNSPSASPQPTRSTDPSP